MNRVQQADQSAPAGRTYPRWIWPLLVTLAIVLPYFLSAVVVPVASPDGWALFELGRSVFHDFYRFTHVRSFSSMSPYSTSFPPLFPSAIAVLDALAGTGARSGYYLAFGCYVAFALLSERLGRRLLDAPWVGLALALVLLISPLMVMDEMRMGRTIPLQLVLYALVLLILLRGERMTLRNAALNGLVTGLAVMNRFDAALLPVLTAAATWWLTRRPALALAVVAGALVAVSPWIAYSIVTFGKIFATDNSGVALSVGKAFVTDWWPVPQPTALDDPGAWLRRVSGNLMEFAAALGRVLAGRAMAAVLLGLALAWAVRFVRRAAPGDGRDRRPAAADVRVVALFAGMTLALLMPQILTAYFDPRYFSALLWAVMLLASALLLPRVQTAQERRRTGLVFSLPLALAAVGYAGHVVAQAAAQGWLDWGRWDDYARPAKVETLKRCLGSDRTARILVIGDDEFAARAGAQGHLRALQEPHNMLDGRLGPDGSRAFLRAYGVDYVFLQDAAQAAFIRATFRLAPVPRCPMPLYAVVAR